MEEQQVAISQQPTPTPSKKFPWKKLILFLVAFLIVVGGVGSVLAWKTTYLDNYLPASVKEFFGRSEERGEPAAGEESSVGEVSDIAGLLLTINKAERVVEESGTKDILLLTVTFENQGNCPPAESGFSECRYDTRWFRLTDEEGFVLDQPEKYPTIEYYETDPLSQRVLNSGEKDQGHVFFEIPKDKNKFFLTYTQFQETSSKILIEPTTFDKTANWKTFRSKKFSYEIKYPSEVKKGDRPTGAPDYYDDVSFSIIGKTQQEGIHFRDGLSIDVRMEDNPEELKLKDWVDKRSEEWFEEGYPEVTKTAESSLGGLPAIRVIGSGYLPFDELCVSRDKKVFIIQGTYVGPDKETYKNIYDQMLPTFKFL